MKIKLSINSHDKLLSQTPGGLGVWNGHQFVVNEPAEDCDAWIIYEGLFAPEECRCPAGRVILITGEPGEVATYDEDWLRNFDKVRSVQAHIRHDGLSVGHLAIPWHLGRGYDFLEKNGLPEKDADISVICSNKTMTKGHRRRIKFVDEVLKGVRMSRFGRGYAEIADKWEGLARFRYSLAIENSRHPHYWTEKISDCFLAGTVPIYWGAPNIRDYFPEDSMIVLDSLDPSEALRIIKEGVSPADYERRLPALLHARKLVMSKYNIFELATGMAASAEILGGRRAVALRPEHRTRLSKLVHRFRNFIRP